MKKINIILFLACTVSLFSCKNNTAESSPEAHNEQEENKTEVELTAAQMNTIEIKTETLQMRNLNAVVKANGYTQVPPQNAAMVSTLIDGVVQDILILEGTYVSKGKKLATIQNLDVVQIQEEYQKALAETEFLKLEFERQKTLADGNVNAKKVFEEVRAKLKISETTAQAAKAKLTALKVNTSITTSSIPIYSPISGYISKVNISKGAYIAKGSPLFEIVDNSQMHLDLNVYEKDLQKIRIGQEVDFVLTNQSKNSIKATIFGINKSFSNESKTVAVHAKINPKDVKNLISGMYVSANININKVLVPTLPNAAIVKDGERNLVFIKESGHSEASDKDGHDGVHFKVIEVIRGVSDLGFTEVKIIDDVPEDAEFVTKGSFYLISAMKGGGEHTH